MHIVVRYYRYAAIGPASNLCEALGERNSALHQGNDTCATNLQNHYLYVATWDTVFQNLVAMRLNKFCSKKIELCTARQC